MKLMSPETLVMWMQFQGLTVRALAKKAGVSHSLIGFLRKGTRRSTSPETARAIAKALNCPVESLFVPEVSTVSREVAGPSRRRAA